MFPAVGLYSFPRPEIALRIQPLDHDHYPQQTPEGLGRVTPLAGTRPPVSGHVTRGVEARELTTFVTPERALFSRPEESPSRRVTT